MRFEIELLEVFNIAWQGSSAQMHAISISVDHSRSVKCAVAFWIMLATFNSRAEVCERLEVSTSRIFKVCSSGTWSQVVESATWISLQPNIHQHRSSTTSTLHLLTLWIAKIIWRPLLWHFLNLPLLTLKPSWYHLMDSKAKALQIWMKINCWSTTKPISSRVLAVLLRPIFCAPCGFPIATKTAKSLSCR